MPENRYFVEPLDHNRWIIQDESGPARGWRRVVFINKSAAVWAIRLMLRDQNPVDKAA
jgi:hypothetical protein